jgi:hypothetical protein
MGWLVTALQALVMVSSEGGAFKFSCGINFHDFKDPWGQDFTPPFDVFGEFATWEIVWQPTFVQWNLRGQQVGVVLCTLRPPPPHTCVLMPLRWNLKHEAARVPARSTWLGFLAHRGRVRKEGCAWRDRHGATQ